MPTYKISQLTTATAVSATNQFEINQNGTSKSVEVSVIDAYIKSTSNLPVVVSVSSATDAVRITQTGTGNALVVEDAANPDATPFVVDASGKVIIGASAPTTLASGVPAFQSNAPGVTPIDGISWFNGANAHFGFGKSRGGTVGVNGIVASGDNTNLDFRFDDGTGFVRAALIAAAVDGTPGTNDMPGRLVFSTTADGASSPTERMRITNGGDVGIGTSSPGSKLDVKGTLRLSGATSGYVGLAPAAAAGSTTYTLPAADGSSGQVLSTNGSGTLSWASSGGTGTLKNVQVFTSSGTYTRTAGVTTAVVIAVGGGGGGKGASGKTAGGNGGNGGTTSFGSHVTALGGTGCVGTTGGAGGTGGTGATIAIKGQGGGAGFSFTVGGTVDSVGGIGGGQGGGAGVRSSTAGNAGVRGGGGSGGADVLEQACNDGAFAGGGGGQGETCIDYITTVGATETVTIGAGGTAGTGTRAGGAGGAGYIIVYEYS